MIESSLTSLQQIVIYQSTILEHRARNPVIVSPGSSKRFNEAGHTTKTQTATSTIFPQSTPRTHLVTTNHFPIYHHCQKTPCQTTAPMLRHLLNLNPILRMCLMPTFNCSQAIHSRTTIAVPPMDQFLVAVRKEDSWSSPGRAVAVHMTLPLALTSAMAFLNLSTTI